MCQELPLVQHPNPDIRLTDAAKTPSSSLVKIAVAGRPCPKQAGSGKVAFELRVGGEYTAPPAASDPAGTSGRV